MEDRRQPGNLFRTASLRLFTIGLLLILYALVQGVWVAYKKERILFESRYQVSAELHRLAERENKLHTDIERVNTPYGVEESLRRQFDFAREGEGVIVIVDDEANQKETVSEKPSFWRRLLPLAPWDLLNE